MDTKRYGPHDSCHNLYIKVKLSVSRIQTVINILIGFSMTSAWKLSFGGEIQWAGNLWNLAQGEHKREDATRWESSLWTKDQNALVPLMKNVLTALQVGEWYLEDYQEIFYPLLGDETLWIQYPYRGSKPLDEASVWSRFRFKLRSVNLICVH